MPRERESVGLAMLLFDCVLLLALQGIQHRTVGMA